MACLCPFFFGRSSLGARLVQLAKAEFLWEIDPGQLTSWKSVANATIFAHLTQLTCVKKYRARAGRRTSSGRLERERCSLLQVHFARFYLHGF